MNLSKSELNVAKLAVQGLKVTEMAEKLFVTPQTVKFHLNNIYKKSGCNGRHQFIATHGLSFMELVTAKEPPVVFESNPSRDHEFEQHLQKSQQDVFEAFETMTLPRGLYED